MGKIIIWVWLCTHYTSRVCQKFDKLWLTMDAADVANHGAKTAKCGKRNQNVVKRPNCKECCQTIRKGAKVQDKWQDRCGKREREWFFFQICLDSQRMTMKTLFLFLNFEQFLEMYHRRSLHHGAIRGRTDPDYTVLPMHRLLSMI